jgi:hypothetical protein
MVIMSGNHEQQPLRLKSISIDKVKNLKNNVYDTREYLASKSENKLARRLYDEWSGFIGISPSVGYWNPVDFVCSNPSLNIKFYMELKERNIQDIYDTLLIGRSKIFRIISEELYPCYIINQFQDRYYVYEIQGDEWLAEVANKSEKDYKNFLISKSIMYSLEEFINKIRGFVRMAVSQQQLNPQQIIP